MSSKGKSIIKKSKSILLNGLEPYEVGKHNFENPVICVEVKAEKRASIKKSQQPNKHSNDSKNWPVKNSCVRWLQKST